MDTMTKKRAEEVLELTGEYTKSDLRKAFANQARCYHPDVASQHGIDEENANDLMTEVNAAFKYLSDFFKDDPRATIRASVSDDDYGFGQDRYSQAYQEPAYHEPPHAQTPPYSQARTQTPPHAQTPPRSQSYAQTPPHAQTPPRSQAQEQEQAPRDYDHPKEGFEPGPIGGRVRSLFDKFASIPILPGLLSIVGRLVFMMAVVAIWRHIGRFEARGWDSPLTDEGVFADPVAYLTTTLGFFIVPPVCLFNLVKGTFSDGILSLIRGIILFVCDFIDGFMGGLKEE